MALSQSGIRSQAPLNCQLCEIQKSIKWKCLDCCLLICDDCKDKIHLKIKNAKDHKIIDLKEIGLHTEELDFTNIKCQVHPGQSCCLFCKSCNILVCPTCFAKDHKKHDLVEIREAYDTKKDELQRRQTTTQKDKAEMIARQDRLSQLKITEISKFENVRMNIKKQEKELKQAVENYTEELITELEQNYQATHQPIEADHHAVTLSIKQADDKLKDVDSFMNTSDTEKFFKEATRVEKYSNALIPQTKTTYMSAPNFIPGQITLSNVGVLKFEDSSTDELKFSIEISQQYESTIAKVGRLSQGADKTLWIADNTAEILQKVKPEGTKLETKSIFNIKIFGMALTSSGNLLVSTDGKLKQICNTTGTLSDSIYNVAPLRPTVIHVTANNKIIVAAGTDEQRSIIIINENGNKEAVFKLDQHNQPLFAYPRSITSTCNGNIHVADFRQNDGIGKVVVLSKEGEIICLYRGPPNTRKYNTFRPVSIVSTPSENVIVVNKESEFLHFLNATGKIITYYNTQDIGIEDPFSISCTSAGQLYIGCTRPIHSSTKKAKIYLVNISGC